MDIQYIVVIFQLSPRQSDKTEMHESLILNVYATYTNDRRIILSVCLVFVS